MNMDDPNKIPTEDIVSKLKELVKEGNVSRILVKRGDTTILNVPLNAGIVGTAIGVAAGPWALIAATAATLGLDAKIELVKKDGSTTELLSREVGKKAASVGSSILSRFSGKD